MAIRRVVTSISLPPGIAARLDSFCRLANQERSSVVVEAIERHLTVMEHQRTIVPGTTLDQPQPRPKRRRHRPELKSKVVELFMPDATQEEKDEATWRWFRVLELLIGTAK